MARRLRVCALAVAMALTAAGAARANGDPASDVLYTGHVFFPYDTTISQSAQQDLVATILAANKAGYPIRVALIAQQSDLGAVTSLWKKPRRYATFLSTELSFIYAGPLLIVMPSGIGFAHYKGRTAAEYRVLSSVGIVGGRDGLALTGTNAVRALAQRAGYAIATGSTPSSSSGVYSWLAVAIAVALIAAAAGGIVFLLWRRPR